MTGPLMAILGCPSGFSGFQSNRISISKTRLISIVLQPIQVIFVVVADVVCVVNGEIIVQLLLLSLLLVPET